MALDLFWNVSAIGLTLLLNVTGALALILPGRYGGREAEAVGLGRHVEALILVSFAITFVFAGLGNVPIWVSDDGVVAVSLLGALVPSVLAFYFLLAAGPLRAFVSVLPVALVAAAAFLTSRVEPGLGIVSEPPGYYLPVLVAAAGALLVGGRTLRAIPLAYAYGVLGGLIGADLLRWEWIFGQPLTAASIGGADAQDLVFLLGLWSAAATSVVLAPRLMRYQRRPAPWADIARLAADGEAHRALEAALVEANAAVDRWADGHALAEAPREEVLHACHARPVFEQVETLRASPQPWDPDAVRRVVENLEGLTRRLAARYPPHVAAPGRRFAAGLIDLGLVVVLMVMAVVAVSGLSLAQAPDETATGLRVRTFLAQVIFVAWVGVAGHTLLPLVIEWASGGRSLGKAIMGLRVRRLSGGKPSGWDHIVRNLARMLDMFTLYIIPFVARPERGRQRLGDHFAETYVMDTQNAATSHTTEKTAPTIVPVSATPPNQEATRVPR